MEDDVAQPAQPAGPDPDSKHGPALAEVRRVYQDIIRPRTAPAASP